MKMRLGMICTGSMYMTTDARHSKAFVGKYHDKVNGSPCGITLTNQKIWRLDVLVPPMNTLP